MLLSIVISSYNDREIIKPYFEAIGETLKKQDKFVWEIIFVDDGSTDGSIEVLEEIAIQNPGVIVIELARNFGQQKAFFAGIKQARGEIVITLDGDFQYPPNCLLTLSHKVAEGYDIASAARTKRKDPWLTRYTSLAAQYFIRRALQIKTKDFGAIKAFSRFIIDKIILYENYCTNVYGMAYALTNSHIDVPVTHLPRLVGHSKWNFMKRMHSYIDLYLAYSPYEATSLFRIGLLFFLLGFSSLCLLLFLFIFYKILFSTFIVVFLLILTVGGLVLILGSLFLSFLLRIYRQMLWKGHCLVERRVIHIYPDKK